MKFIVLGFAITSVLSLGACSSDEEGNLDADVTNAATSGATSYKVLRIKTRHNAMGNQGCNKWGTDCGSVRHPGFGDCVSEGKSETDEHGRPRWKLWLYPMQNNDTEGRARNRCLDFEVIPLEAEGDERIMLRKKGSTLCLTEMGFQQQAELTYCHYSPSSPNHSHQTFQWWGATRNQEATKIRAPWGNGHDTCLDSSDGTDRKDIFDLDKIRLTFWQCHDTIPLFTGPRKAQDFDPVLTSVEP